MPALRASDADRERAVLTLGRAAGEGRLDVDELEERLQAAYAARTHAELDRLLADIGGMIAPGSAPPAPAPAPAPRARVVRSGDRGAAPRGSSRSWAATSAPDAGRSPSAATS